VGESKRYYSVGLCRSDIVEQHAAPVHRIFAGDSTGNLIVRWILCCSTAVR